ncbi:MAG TPA: hypothetical protein VL094_13335 [Sphingomonadaceae bacterium]|nr:hypothetical protein [Sphingomonadaceae bacterium]
MTVTVETPEGVRSGSAVLESTMSEGVRYGDAGGIHYGLKGEAVAVDMPDGKTLFALLSSVARGDPLGYHARLFDMAILADPALRSAYGLKPNKMPSWQESHPEIRRRNQAATLAPELYPMLVTFRDIADPTSVEQVDPADLAASFGAGVKLKRITLKITDDPVTIGIEKRLPKPIYKGFFNWDGNISTFKQSEALGIWDFTRWHGQI